MKNQTVFSSLFERWIAEDATFVKRPWDESPPLENHPGLEFGKPLLGKHFPEIPTHSYDRSYA